MFSETYIRVWSPIVTANAFLAKFVCILVVPEKPYFLIGGGLHPGWVDVPIAELS